MTREYGNMPVGNGVEVSALTRNEGGASTSEQKGEAKVSIL